MSIEHCKVPGLRQKVQELQAGGVGLALGTFGIFWDLFGSLRGTHDDVCFAMLCFCYHSFVDCFVVKTGHMRCGVRDVQETCNDETVPFKCLRQPSSVA